MNSSFRIAFVANTLALAVGSASGKTGREIAPEQRLSIHLYDDAQVPVGTLKSATVEATRLFRAAGMRISWEQVRVEAPEDRGIDMSSSGSWQPVERHYLVVRLIRGTRANIFSG